MKTMKRLSSLLLALALVLTLALPAFAAPTTGDYKLTVQNAAANHTYTAYQIFKGTVHNTANADNEDGSVMSDRLGDIDWGDGISEAGVTALKNAADLVDGVEDVSGWKAADWAEALQDKKVDVTAFAAFVAKYPGEGHAEDCTGDSCVIENLPAGYYLITDEFTNGTANEGDVLSKFMMEVVGNATVVSKTEKPTLEKEIVGEDGNEDGVNFESPTGENGKKNEVDIGMDVKYQLKGTIPSDANVYDYYFYIISDTLSKGLTLKGAPEGWDGKEVINNWTGITVKANGTPLTMGEDYTLVVHKEGDETIIEIALLDAKSHAGETITVEYTATLNEDAKLGNEGNPNTADLEYSNDPTYKGDGENDFEEGKPGFPDREKDIPTGKTPKDETKTYTTGIIVHKIDGETKQPLTGAGFTITGNAKGVTVRKYTKYELNDESGDYYGLKNGTYTTEEPRTEETMVERTGNRDAGYVKVSDVGEDENRTEIEVGGVKYYAANREELDGTVQLYTLLEPNADEYDGHRYDLVEGEEEIKTEDIINETVMVDENGNLNFAGLGEGDYTITETTTPAGYNTVEATDVQIRFVKNDCKVPGCTQTEGHFEFRTKLHNADWKDDGTEWQHLTTDETEITLIIENVKGVQLPETGGIGTTIFYIAGSIMVLGAGTLLVLKKRRED